MNTHPLEEDLPTRKVVGQAGARDHTRKVGRVAPGIGQGPNQTLGYLSPGSILLGRYVVKATLHPHETSLPGLFHCRGRERDVMVKVAPLAHPPKRELWGKLQGLVHPTIIRVFETVEEGGLYYEVQEFCQGGALSARIGTSQMDTAWILGKFVPQINEALKYLHAQGVVHRDVKPSNIFLKENSLESKIVLGDFDISSMLVSDHTSRNTSRTEGTWEYTAPEAFPRFADDRTSDKSARITRAADYYALGVSIIELLLGTTSLHACDLPDLFDFYLSGQKIELPGEPPELVRLLKGLLIRNRHKRWGASEIDRWLRGATLPSDIQSILEDDHFSLNRALQPYSIGSLSAQNLVDLAEILESSWEEAKSHLMESDLLVGWIASLDTDVAHQVEKNRERFRRDPDIALLRCIVICDPSRLFQIEGYGRIGSSQQWLSVLASAPTERHLASGPISDQGLLRFQAWLELKSSPEKSLADKVSKIRKSPIHVRFEEIAFLLDPRLPYSGEVSAFLNLKSSREAMAGGLTPQEVVAEAFGLPEDWNSGIAKSFISARNRWEQGYLDAWARQRGLEGVMAKATDAIAILKGNRDNSFDTALRYLDPTHPKPVLRILSDEKSDLAVISLGSESTKTFSFAAVGTGMPFGALRIESAPNGLSLKNPLIRARKGEIVVEFDASRWVASGARENRITLDRGNFEIADGGVSFRYRVSLPYLKTLAYLGISALLGAVLIGGPRLFAWQSIPHAVTWRDINYSDLSEHLDVWVAGHGAYPVVFVLACAAMYGGFRLVLEAMKRGRF